MLCCRKTNKHQVTVKIQLFNNTFYIIDNLNQVEFDVAFVRKKPATDIWEKHIQAEIILSVRLNHCLKFLFAST